MKNFKEKIELIYNKIYKKNINQLTEVFLPVSNPTKTQIRSRKITINKWLRGEIDTPYHFQSDYNRYPISQKLTETGDSLLPLESFTLWSLEEFEKRLDNYQNNQLSQKETLLSDYQYLYTYSERKKELVYLKITYLENDQVEMTTNHYETRRVYKGRVELHKDSGILHYIVSSEFEKIFFSFSNLQVKLNNNCYGLQLSKSFSYEVPISSLVLLSKEILKKEEESFFMTKLNSTNTLLAQNKQETEEESFINTISSKLNSMHQVTNSYNNSNNLFLNLLLEEFNIFYKKFNSALTKNEFSSFHTINQLLKNILSFDMLLKKELNIKLFYTINDIDKSIFGFNSLIEIELYNLIVDLQKEKKISMELIFYIDDEVKLNKQVQDKLKMLESLDIPLYFKENNKTIFSSILIIEDYNLGSYSLKNEEQYKVINDLNIIKGQYEIEKSRVINLTELLNSKNELLQGEWYLYVYGRVLHEAELNIDANTVKINLIKPDKREYRGIVSQSYGNIVLSTELGLIRFREHEQRPIKIVTLMSGQTEGDDKDVVTFAILSRWCLKQEELDDLFPRLVNKEFSPYEQASFKLSLGLDEKLRELVNKYQDV